MKKLVSKKAETKKPPKTLKKGPQKGESFDNNGIPICPANQNNRTYQQLRNYCIKN